MTHGILALWERTLRGEARTFPSHLLRAALLGLAYAALLIVIDSAGRRSAPGFTFFVVLASLNVAIPFLTGMQIFSSVITSEREEGTLPLLVLTGMSPLSILLGKSTTVLLQMLLLLIVQLPIALFSVTLGGVAVPQVLAAGVALVAYVVCLANVGLLNSVLLQRTGNAVGLTFFWGLCYLAFLPACAKLAQDLQLHGSPWIPASAQSPVVAGLRFLSEQSVVLRLGEICRSGFHGSPWCWQVLTNLAFGVVCFLLAWWRFPAATRDVGDDPLTKQGPSLFSRLAGTGEIWRNPLMWKGFHFEAAGWPGTVGKLLCYLLACGFSVWMMTEGFQRDVPLHQLLTVCAGTMLMLLGVELLIHAGQVIQVEYQARTWSLLLLLPRSAAGTVYAKLAGRLVSMIPVVVMCGLTLIASLRLSPYDWGYVRWDEVVGFWIVALSMYFCLVHYVAWLQACREQRQGMVRLCVSLVALVLIMLIWGRVRPGISGVGVGVLLTVTAWGLMGLMQWSIGRDITRGDAD